MHDPASIAQDPSYIHAAVLFADIENSVMISATLPPQDYDKVLNDFQASMQALVDDLRAQGYPVGEVSIAGDQLSIFFYDPSEVERNARLDDPNAAQGEEREALKVACRRSNENLVFLALKAAIMLKNCWLLQSFNLERVHHQREPLGLGIGMHTGQVYLRSRPDGRQRIEGFVVNLAKRIEGYSRQGQYSHIMLSEDSHNKLRGMVVKHTQLRQRIYFQRHDVALELLKGVAEAQAVFELKFFSLIGLHVAPEVVDQYESLFFQNPRNIWAYYQLFEHYAYQVGDWERVLHLAKYALLAHPKDEKVLLDLSRYYLRQGNRHLARELGLQALSLNPDFDLVHEHLGVIAGLDEDIERQLEYTCKAVGLAPGSPINHLNLGLALCEAGNMQAAEHHLSEALRGYPEYENNASTVQLLREHHERNRLPGAISSRLGFGKAAVAE